MKSIYLPVYFILIIILITFISCKKNSADSRPKEELILGKWSINTVRVEVYYNGSLVKDSIVPNNPNPENFVTFSSNGSLAYQFNKPAPDAGTYQFVGSDSLYATIGTTIYKWKSLLLTTQIFNVQNTQGYPPISGSTVVTYQTFVK